MVFACWIFLTINVRAEVLRWTQICDSGKLQITNRSSQPAEAWLQKFSPGLTEETELTLPAGSTREITIENKVQNATYSLLHFKKSGTVKTVFHCDNKIFLSTATEGGQFLFKKSVLEKNSLYLQNLFFDKNTVQIEFLNDHLDVVQTEMAVLLPFEKLNYQFSEKNSLWTSVRLQAENRFVAFQLSSTGSSLASEVSPQPTATDPDAKYFVVSDRINPVDSFIIKVTDPAMIAKAREQISQPKLEKIVFARIQKGHGQFNRNWSKPEKSFWSWSTLEVTNISDLGSTSCNGLPQAVEDRAELWINEPGRICFWSYRIKKELTALEVSTGIEIP